MMQSSAPPAETVAWVSELLDATGVVDVAVMPGGSVAAMHRVRVSFRSGGEAEVALRRYVLTDPADAPAVVRWEANALGLARRVSVPSGRQSGQRVVGQRPAERAGGLADGLRRAHMQSSPTACDSSSRRDRRTWHAQSVRSRSPRIESKCLRFLVTSPSPCSSAVAAMSASGSRTPNSRATQPARSAIARSTASSRKGASNWLDRLVAVLPAKSSARVTTE